ncbi:hypothetical protein Dpo_15c00870 [Desulfotignum phosphitoxidans DSM 13687]|uniref:Uncharacterized protein n=1 Tax=Desulfotignum phosphitoxidans DSM 13687 TaxID=1286635 RepID=S0G1C1_9BACT|nr:hypothetical protein Dpo_15c00870 [Desulfotignum phosphitoxidans DSM 13687]
MAAFKLTGYLKPQNVILYAKEEKLREILLQNRLKKTENGNIEIYKKFWSIDGKQDKSIVHPFIIYADLLEINNQRTIETAKVIYDQNIAMQFIPWISSSPEGKAVFHLTPQHHDVMILIKLWRCNYDHIIETFNHIFRPIATSGFTNKSPGDIEINVGNNQ